jgi:demethylmenaquinone methyltransferase/2-methoxy-6-polyprenyl-1,4-benzoquinol methylase
MLLADTVGPGGHVTGVDIDSELLEFGEKLAEQRGFSDRITYQQGDMRSLPFAENTFDWAWSADCVGYPVGELKPLLGELLRVVKPGSKIFLLAWTSQNVLPGYPVLEARLNATCSAYLPFLRGVQPEFHFLSALRCFREAGLEEVQGQTFVGDIQAPLDQAKRNALASLFGMLWGERTAEVSPEDWSEYQRLCTPGSPDFIVDQEGYYAFFTYTLFQGKVGEISTSFR